MELSEGGVRVCVWEERDRLEGNYTDLYKGRAVNNK